jgi:hypothetical protein
LEETQFFKLRDTWWINATLNHLLCILYLNQ